MNKVIKTDKKWYLIRGPWSPAQLHLLFQKYCEKYPKSRASGDFDYWLAHSGKVYTSIPKTKGRST